MASKYAIDRQTVFPLGGGLACYQREKIVYSCIGDVVALGVDELVVDLLDEVCDL